MSPMKQSRLISIQLKRLVDVYDVVDATKENCHVREHALVISLKPDETMKLKN